MSKSDPREQTVFDLDDDDEIEIIEVVGLDDDSPAGSVIPDDDPDEVVLSLDSPDFLDEEEDPEPSGTGPPELSDQERMLRIQADFENFKKRVEREAEEIRQQAAASLICRILPVLDNLERALSADSGAENSGDNLREGVALIFRQLLDELRREGVEAIESVGQAFDPKIHDAVETCSMPELPADTVIEELQRGYRLHKRVLRAALVKVNLAESQS